MPLQVLALVTGSDANLEMARYLPLPLFRDRISALVLSEATGLREDSS